MLRIQGRHVCLPGLQSETSECVNRSVIRWARLICGLLRHAIQLQPSRENTFQTQCASHQIALLKSASHSSSWASLFKLLDVVWILRNSQGWKCTQSNLSFNIHDFVICISVLKRTPPGDETQRKYGWISLCSSITVTFNTPNHQLRSLLA